MRRERLEPLNLSTDPPKAEALPESLDAPAREASEDAEASALPPLPPLPDLDGPTTARAADLPAIETPRQRKLRPKAERKAVDAPPSAPAPVKATAPSPPKAQKPRAPARFAYLLAGVCALVWTGAFLAFVTGFGRLGPFDYGPFRDVIVGALAILPALFMLLFAYALRQGAKLGEDVRTTRKLSEDLVGPVAVSAAQTGDLMRVMRVEIEQAAQAAEEAERRLAALREGLSDESRRLAEAAQEAQAGARLLGEALGQERGGLETLSAALEARTAEVTEAVSRQSRMAADVSDLAQAQLAEAQAALVARAADLSAAAADVRDGAAAAADLLAEQGDRLDSVGAGLSQRLVRLGDELNRERERLADLTEGLRTDHDDLSARAESQYARMTELAGKARADGEITAASAAEATEALQALVAEAAAQVRGAADAAVEARLTVLSDAQVQIERFHDEARLARAAAAAEAQDSLAGLSSATEQAHAAAALRMAQLEEQAQALGASALERIEQLGEAAFAAGQRADQAFDARIGAAKRAIDQSAAAVEEAGLRSAARIEAGLAGARAALVELDSLLSDVDGRFSKLPEEARERADAVRSAVEQGVGDLTAAARRAAEETQAIDEAFQERVRKNYDTLSEAVRLMGRVAGAVDAAASRPIEGPTPIVVPAAAVAPARVAASTVEAEEARIEPAPLPAPSLDDRAAPKAEVHAMELLARAREAAAERRAEPVAAAPLPMAVGDSHHRFAATASAAPQTSRPEPVQTYLRETSPGASAGAWGGDGGSDLFAPPAPTPMAEATAAGLRPRLKLTSAPEPASALRPAASTGRGEGWSWKDLLSSLPPEPLELEEAGDDDALADRLIGEIEALGLDAAALLPRAQVEEIAHSLQSGRAFAARDGVRRLAPAAVRRLSRRVLTDPVLRREADLFVRRYAVLVDDAVRRDADGFLASALLGSDAGRAFLLLDAAIGDLAH